MKHNDAGDPYIRQPLVDYRDKKFHMSDDQKYVEQLQLEEALVLSSASHASTSSSSKQPPIDSSKLPERYCGIFWTQRLNLKCFGTPMEYIAVKIKENIADVRCPDPSCKGLIRPEVCRFIVPREVLIRWENALCESMILGSQKFYCPFKDCSALLVDDGGQSVTSSECPHCNRLFCAQCQIHTPINLGLKRETCLRARFGYPGAQLIKQKTLTVLATANERKD
ncbi:Zinc finger, C6HC-type [Artemisia annua]|uniref:Zinc finger, C6HC-type n=1 Tax=Artemisia annua TaxID=35608 RepID=A0A2U1P439_ARTAN|nr:Zinc finger, C6HC-type [Artemisia annua]